MEAFFRELVFWHWWIVAVILIVLEALAPGVIFLWVGIGAGVTGLALLIKPELTWETQLVLFSVLSVISGVAGRLWVSKHPTESEQPLLNQRGDQYIGRTFTLEDPITDGVGSVKVDDSIWRIVGDDATAGSKIKVVGVEGSSFRVEGV
jgi:membrane protein implicated in regulation of membrane protease activity